MGWKLPDNAREALQFLFVATAVVVLLRLAMLFSDFTPTEPLTSFRSALRPFRNGYQGLPTDALPGGHDLFTRLMGVLVLVVAAGLVVWVLMRVILRAVGQAGHRWAVRAARITMVLLLSAGILSALWLPPKTFRLAARSLEITSRPTVAQVLALPWGERVERIPADRITLLMVEPLSGRHAGGYQVTALLNDGGQRGLLLHIGSSGTADTLHEALGRWHQRALTGRAPAG